MKALERGHRLHQELAKRKTPLSMMAICDLFEGCSESTSKRSIRDLKALGAPIYCTEGLGYSYDKHIAFELPSVWFSHEELQALLTIQKLTSHLSGGFFDESTHMIRQKAENLLGEYMQSPQNMQRIRILATGSRAKSLPMFPTVASAVVEQKCLLIQYENRHAQKTSEREVSPQRLVYYKGNWYLDVWCHQADDFRSFAVEKIKAANFIHKPCKNIPEKDLDLHFSTSFGIFAGEPIAEAVLHFSAKVAAWVQDEEWFPGLLGKDLDNGGYELRIPYHNPTELVMEICRYGADVKVIEPLELQKQVVGVLQKSIAQYL
jgi:predicted DNA-binding transcriptional regulator YafY